MSAHIRADAAFLCLPDFEDPAGQASPMLKYCVSPGEKNASGRLFGIFKGLLDRYFGIFPYEPGDPVALVLSAGKPDLEFLSTDYRKGGVEFMRFAGFSAEEEIKSRYRAVETVETASASCITGLALIKKAVPLLGRYRRCLVLSAEAAGSALLRAGYGSLGVLSRGGIMRPFSADRDGFVMGSGGALLALSAGLGAEGCLGVVREVALHNFGTDFAHYSGGGVPAGDAIKNALGRAGLCPGDIGYINAHGTATVYNDRLETAVLKNAFGRHLRDIPVSSTKPFTGHCLSASALIETAISFISLKEGYIFPTMNFRKHDPECDIDCVPLTGVRKTIDNFMKLSLGFGGNAGILIGGAS